MKRLLLDTHTFLWWLADDPALGIRARQEIGRGDNLVFISAVSVWEIAIKRAIGKLSAPEGIEETVTEERFIGLPVSLHHATRAGALPPHHRDPFDRMLIAQAQAEGLILVTGDGAFERYGVEVLSIGG